MSIVAFPPLPIREDWAPAYLRGRPGAVNRDFAFRLVDAQGAPSATGTRYHSAVDWFAPGLAEVWAPRAGRVIRVSPSSGNTGQVFGGVVSIQEPSGLVWVMRHVDPAVTLGQNVAGGERVARVTAWRDGPSHLHLEIWRSAGGGYVHENMLDPAGVDWTMVPAPVPPEASHYFEEMPHRSGGTGPALVGQAAGYAQLAIARGVVAALRARYALSDIGVSLLRGEDRRYYVLTWAAGTHGLRWRFGPWSTAAARDEVLKAREANTRRRMRPFDGRSRSRLPWPLV